MKLPSACPCCNGVRLSRVLVPVLLASTLMMGSASGAESNAAASAPVTAKWVSRKLHYVYQGFTAHYSCDGLQDAVKRILLQLGARPDLVVRRSGCTRLEGPEPSPGVNVTFSVLEPADSADKGAAAGKGAAPDKGAAADKGAANNESAANSPDVAARWEPVTLQASTPTRDNSGGCELIQDVKKQFLPLFATRNLKYSSDCFPHTESLAGADLRVEVLRPVKPPAPQPAQR